MNLLELREKIDKEIQQGFGYMKVLSSPDENGLYEEAECIEFDKFENGYIIY